jgi:hypothetical protein
MPDAPLDARVNLLEVREALNQALDGDLTNVADAIVKVEEVLLVLGVPPQCTSVKHKKLHGRPGKERSSAWRCVQDKGHPPPHTYPHQSAWWDCRFFADCGNDVPVFDGVCEDCELAGRSGGRRRLTSALTPP